MTALILFTRELVAEFARRADAIDESMKDDSSLSNPRNAKDHDAMVVIMATSTILRQIGEVVSVAAKRAFHL